MNYKLLRVDVSNRKFSTEQIESDVAEKFVGGRGIAAKILWDELNPGIDPLGEKNKLIVAGGPLSGLPIPSAGKLVIAAKSPVTGGYGDGNIGSNASVQLRRTGYDGVLFEGVSEEPVHVHITDEGVKFHGADELWGLDTFQKEDKLNEYLGKNIGSLVIGPGGENLVRYATVMSQKGRAGGRTGMGAVLGSKKVAAVTFKGNAGLRVKDQQKLTSLAKEGYAEIRQSEDYDFWTRQGTMLAVRLCNLNSALPVHNFSQGVFEHADELDGYAMERMKKDRKGCPACNMQCGNMIKSAEDEDVELDYENIAMLGSNLGIGSLKHAGSLNRLCDRYGLDTISTGSSIAFAMEASQKGIIDFDLEFGDYEGARKMIDQITTRKDLGDQLAQGVKRTAKKWGQGSENWAMHVKGLEISAYNCFAYPGMALAFGTSPIGGHHKDCWVIAWEIEHERDSYSDRKIEEILNHQRKRGGAFESFTTCRLPWIEVDFDLQWYEKFLEAATGTKMSWKEFDRLGDRIYALIRSIFAREYGEKWNRSLDIPPQRWFQESLSEGDFKGEALDKESYMDMLGRYYDKRGWDDNGVPTRTTLNDLGLDFVVSQLEETVSLSD